MAENGTSRRVLAFLVLFAALVRLPGLNEGLWFDEIWTLVDQIRAPLTKSISQYENDNNHPLYSICAWLSVRVFGESAWALRLPALLFGVASVLALYFFARRLVSERIALFACAVLTLSHHHVAYSQNARAYTMLLFFTLVSCTGFLESLKSRKPGGWLVHGVALALGTYAHLTAIFVALAQLVVWLVFGLRREKRTFAPLLGLVVGGTLSLVLHAPMLGAMTDFFFGRASGPKIDAEWTSLAWTLSEIGRSVGVGGIVGIFALSTALVIGLVGLATIARRDSAAALLCVLPTLLGGLTLVLLGRNLWPRFFFFCAGFYVVVGAAGLARPFIVRNTKLAGALAGLCLVVLASRLPGTWEAPNQDFVAAQEWVDAQREPGDVIVTLGLARFPFEEWLEVDYVPVESVAELEAAIAPAKRAFALSTFPIYLESREPEVAGWLGEHGLEERRFHGWIGGGDIVLYRLR